MHQDEVHLVGGQHGHRDVLVGQWGDGRLDDLGHADGLETGEAAGAGYHIEGQPGNIGHTQVF